MIYKRRKIKDADEWLNEKLKKAYGEEEFKQWHEKRIDELEGKKGCPHTLSIKIIYDKSGSYAPPVMREEEREALYLSALRPLKK